MPTGVHLLPVPFCPHAVVYPHCDCLVVPALVLGCLLVIIATLAAIFLASTSLAVSLAHFVLSCEALTISLVCELARALVFTLVFYTIFALCPYSFLSPPPLAIIPCCASSTFHKLFTLCLTLPSVPSMLFELP